jgi:hypothetical protein
MLRKITAMSYPYDYGYDLYQEYYWKSLDVYCRSRGVAFMKVSNVRFPGFFRNLRKIRNSYKLRRAFRGSWFPAIVDASARAVSLGKATMPAPHVGIYVFNFDDFGETPVCIDSSDTHEISCEHANRCAVYFKTNFWRGTDYPSNVFPLPNMNPLVGRDMDLFRKLRTASFKWDLFAFVRVWGGKNEVDGIDHNIRVLEKLSKVKCKSFVLAYLVCGDIAAQKARLDSLGIRWTTRPMPAQELWKIASESRLNLVRMGMHQCTPWRLIDILAMGRIPIFDYSPLSQWPVPLLENQNFLNLDFNPTEADSRKCMTEAVCDWISDTHLLSSICQKNAEYFDRHLAFEKLGGAVVGTVELLHSRKSPSRSS